MVGRIDYSSVPTNVDLENNSNQKKYTINKDSDKSLVISRALCALMAIGAILLAILAGLIVFFLIPRCEGEESTSPAAFVERNQNFLAPYNNVKIDERLPGNIIPIHYRLKITPNFANSSSSGTVSIDLLVAHETNQIIFNINKIQINKHSVTLKPSNKNELIEILAQNELDGERYEIKLDKTLTKDETYVLDMSFEGELNGQLQGFYKSQYKDVENSTLRNVASTQFSPTDARRAFPCFDEPIFKANFTISIARPSNMFSLSNMPKIRSENVENQPGWIWDHFDTTPKVSTYLVAFVISDLVSAPSTDQNIHIYSKANLRFDTKYARVLAPNILHFFEDYFQIKFPLPKIDIVALPEFGFSAMENWGLITFRESSLLFDQTSSTIEDKRTIATVLSHEIGHQWFGNLVTPKWWNDLWLKEGFATYLEYLGVDHAEPQWNIMPEFLPSEIYRAFAKDALLSSRPLSFEVKNNKQIREAFDEISYAKGASIIRMMNHFLGEETFKIGLINFLNKYKFENADRNDLFASLTEVAHQRNSLHQDETVKDIMDTWTKQAGFPVISAKADRKLKKLTITQNRFLLLSANSTTELWWVPLSLITKETGTFNDSTPKIWLKKQKESTVDLSLPNETSWYLLNLNQTGYFIVNYDETNWNLLIENIMSFPQTIRAQLISDSMDLARANLLDYDIPLRLVARMARRDVDIMFVATKVALSKLQYLSDILSSTPAFGLFEEYHNSIFQKTYSTVEFLKVEDYTTNQIITTVLEWACRNSDSKCVYQSINLFRNWMHGNTVFPNLKKTIFCTAIREGNEREWNYALEQFEKSQLPSEKNILLESLGCTKLKWLLSRYLNQLLTTSIQIQDADRVFESVAKNKFGTSIAFDFLRKNWSELQERYGDGFSILARMVKALASHMNTEFQLSELIRFRDSVKDNIGTTEQAFESAIETVRANVAWMENNYDSVESWLMKQRQHYIYF